MKKPTLEDAYKLKAKFNISLATFSWYHYYPIERCIEKTAEIGYKGMEINGCRPHMEPDDYSKDRVKQVRKALEEYGVKCACICPYDGTYHFTFSTPNEGLRNYTIKHTKQCIELAHDLGSPIIECSSGPHRVAGDDMDESWNRMVEGYLELADFASKYNITLAAEHKCEHRLSTFAELMKLMKVTNHKNIRMLLDMNHQSVNPPETFVTLEEAIELATPWLIHMHASDSPRHEHRHLPISEGEIDWESALAVLKKVGYDKWITVEMEEVEDPFAASMKSLRVLKQYM